MQFFILLSWLFEIFGDYVTEPPEYFYINEGRHFDLEEKLKNEILNSGLKFYKKTAGWISKDGKRITLRVYNPHRVWRGYYYEIVTYSFPEFEYNKDIFIKTYK